VLEEILLDLAGFQLTGLNVEWFPLDIDEMHCPRSFFLTSSIQIIQSIILVPPIWQVSAMLGSPGGFPNCAIAFWVGMQPVTRQRAILQLCALCPSVDTLAVFLCRNWNRPEKGNANLIMQTYLP
jgi:hypothetical protein